MRDIKESADRISIPESASREVLLKLLQFGDYLNQRPKLGEGVTPPPSGNID